MTQLLDAPVKYQVRHSRRAKRLCLKVLPTGVEVVIPANVSEQEAHQFVAQHQDWLKKQLSQLKPQRHKIDNTWPPTVIHLAALNEKWQLQIVYRQPSYYAQLVLNENQTQDICLGKHSHREHVRQLLMQWVKCKARYSLTPWLQRLALEYGFKMRNLSYRNQKSRWGSCNQDGDISLNLKLLFLPPSATEYVMIHELCHTVFTDHSSNFWHLVGQIIPDYKRCEAELNQQQYDIPGWLDA
ncbi:MAG: SprT family zinc-dependent metalloprotease [Coxiellaceae bacterium]|nr:SprT family zinc-dependent metalloprotease [Coxiellaceae bacterium]